MPAKTKMIAFSNNDPLTTWLSAALGKQLSGYNHQGTVSITALITLMRMGCNPIFLLGQDLAYPEGKMYASNAVYRNCRLVEDENGNRRIEMENKKEFFGYKGFYNSEEEYEATQQKHLLQMIEVKGWNGETLYSSMSYNAFRKAFEKIQQKNPSTHIVNCSQGGAYINGLEHLPFPEAIQKYSIQEFSPRPALEQFLQEQYQEGNSDTEAFVKVYQRYLQDCKDLSILTELVKDGRERATKAMKEAETKKIISGSLQSRLKKLVELDHQLAELARNNVLINAFIKTEMFKFNRDYGRKLAFEDPEDKTQLVGDMQALKENLETTLMLYNALEKGAKRVVETLEPIVEQFSLADKALVEA